MLGAILFITVFVRFAAPVKDGDFFWHVKYGEYMIENRTPVPDHSLYSWTPANNKAIYCTWIGDIFLYLMNRAGGLPLLVVFRYLCTFTLIFAVWAYAWRMGQGRDIFTFIVLIIVVLSSYSASFLKPEIMSMVFMAIASGLYFSVKASLWGKWGTKPFLFYPFLFLLWVNIHGVFLFGLLLLALITFGETLNYRFSRQCSLTAQGMRHLLTGAVLSLLATFATPYGYKLHLYLFNDRVLGEGRLSVKHVAAFQPIFDRTFFHMHYVELWVIMLMSFVVLYSLLVWKKWEWDWAVLLPTIFLALFFARFVRATYYWPAFWGMSLIYLRTRIGPYWQITPRAGTALKSAFILLFLFLSGRAIYDSRFSPFLNQWLGFGIGYANPVQASEFLKEHRPGKLLYNSYGVGGYLIYDLYPGYKVFCDPRFFPYKEWYAQYREFNNAEMRLSEFQDKYPFDVAVVDYHFSKKAINKFLLSRQWAPVFYGPSAVIFVREDAGFSYDIHRLDKHRFDGLKTLHQAYTVFIVAQNIDDLETSCHILELIKKKFSYMAEYEKIVRVCTIYQEALAAMAEGDYEKAFAKLNPVGLYPNRLKANASLVKLRNWKVRGLVKNGEYREALGLIEATLQVIPVHVTGLYNAGIIGYIIETRENSQKESDVRTRAPDKKAANWKNYLKRFLELAPNHQNAPIARDVLEGRGHLIRLPLM